MRQACFYSLSLFHRTSTHDGAEKYGGIVPQNQSKNKLMQFCYCLCVTGRRHFNSRRASLKQQRLGTG